MAWHAPRHQKYANMWHNMPHATSRVSQRTKFFDFSPLAFEFSLKYDTENKKNS
jgi:hypothetical protein